jgi:hypothetical protein
MDKQLAHLSYFRDKEWVHYDWVPKLEKEFRTAWQEFLRAVDPRYSEGFAIEIAECRRKQSFTCQRRSKIPQPWPGGGLQFRLVDSE